MSLSGRTLMFMCLMACHGSSAMVLFILTTILLEHSAAQQECSHLRLRLHQVLDKNKFCFVQVLGQNDYVFCHLGWTNLCNILVIY